MQGCNNIRRLIEEADQPDIFPLEVTGHVAHCNACRSFAAERSALRELIASGKRVSAPVNFDVMLNARLAEVRGRRTLSWLNPAAFMRMGAAAAGLVIALLVIQYTGIFSPADESTSSGPVAAAPIPHGNPQPLPIPAPPLVPVPEDKVAESAPMPVTASVASSRGPAVSIRRVGRGSQQTDGAANFEGIEDGGVILVRGQNGEREVPLPTVSVGAQPLLYGNSKPSASRSAGTSF